MNKKLLSVAVQAAKAAGALQKKGFGKKHNIQFKGEINLVTEVDKACEKKIVSIISKAFPDHDFLTEEFGAHNKKSDYKWIIDPLDGTTNYAHAFPSFCVSIGLEYQGEVVLGVVFNPIHNELFTGIKGQGAWLNGKRIHVSAITELKRSLLGTGFAYNVQVVKNNNLNHLENFLKRAQGIRRMGAAAIDICYVACGRLEGFWEMELWPWDIAAGCLILSEAGGATSMFDGSPLDLYGKQIICSNAKIHKDMVKVVKMGMKAFK